VAERYGVRSLPSPLRRAGPAFDRHLSREDLYPKLMADLMKGAA
jgi:hypothetical protein